MGKIKPFEERLAEWESWPEGPRSMLHKPVKGEYRKLRKEIFKRVKDLGLNDLNEILYVLKEMKSGEYRYPHYRHTTIR